MKDKTNKLIQSNIHKHISRTNWETSNNDLVDIPFDDGWMVGIGFFNDTERHRF